jgi:hypothetical protein
LLETAYQNGQDAKEQAKADAQTGKTRAQRQLADPYPSGAATTTTRSRRTTGR